MCVALPVALPWCCPPLSRTAGRGHFHHPRIKKAQIKGLRTTRSSRYPTDQRGTRGCVGVITRRHPSWTMLWILYNGERKTSIAVWKSLTSWVQKETPVERLFSRGRLRSRMERGLSSPSFSSSFLSISVQAQEKMVDYTWHTEVMLLPWHQKDTKLKDKEKNNN